MRFLAAEHFVQASETLYAPGDYCPDCSALNLLSLDEGEAQSFEGPGADPQTVCFHCGFQCDVPDDYAIDTPHDYVIVTRTIQSTQPRDPGYSCPSCQGWGMINGKVCPICYGRI